MLEIKIIIINFVAVFTSFIIVFVDMFPLPLERIRLWTIGPPPKEKVIVPCTTIGTQDVWVRTFPKFISEAPLKLNDVNKDGIEDIIVGYGTGKTINIICFFTLL